MDAALVVITLLSLGLTGALVVYATRLQREAQQRSDARVAALAAEVRVPQESPAPAAAPHARRAAAPAPLPSGSDSGHVGRFRVDAEGGGPRIAPADLAPDASRPATRRDTPPAHATPPALFEVARDGAPGWRRTAAFAAIGATLVFLVAFVLGRPGGAETPPPAGAGDGAPLELVLLQHQRTGSDLTVSGVVRNPRGSADRNGLAAVVFLFDRSGSFLSSSRTPIDYQRLAGGDESPFAVTIQGAGTVGRYRVSFRTERAVVPHVDQRQVR